MTAITPIDEASTPAILALNNAHAAETSALDPAGLDRLLAQAFYAMRIGDEAFLIALDQDANYASPNFAWFKERYARFVYVDRVITAAAARGRGHARALYEDLMAWAVRAGHVTIGCEVNLEPPNPGSDAFHAALGFVEVGRASIDGGRKRVRYLIRDLPAAG